MDVRLHRVLILGATLALSLGSGCAKERGLEPGPAKYYAYVSIWQDTAAIIMFDMDADTIVDSIREPQWDQLDLIYDDQTGRVAAWQNSVISFYHGGQTTHFQTLTTGGGSHTFTQSPDYFVSSRGGRGGREDGDGVVPQQIDFYDASDFPLVFSDTIGLEQMYASEADGLIYGRSGLSTETGTLIRDDFAAYDYINRRLHQIWVINPDSLDEPYSIGRFVLDATHRLLYAVALNPQLPPRLICYDLIADSLIFANDLYGPSGDFRLTPDGRELWYPDPGGGGQFGSGPETITIYDAHTGGVLDVISTKPYRFGTTKADPWKIRFHPSGNKAYVTCGFIFYGPLLVIDVPSREVTKVFWQRDVRWLYDIEAVLVQP